MTKQDTTRIAVVGAGSWGTTVANLLASNGHEVRLWAREPNIAKCLNETRENARYLPGVRLDSNLTAVVSLGEALTPAQIVVLAIPAQSLRGVIREIGPMIPADAIIVNLAKGIEESTGARCSEIVAQELKAANPIGVLAGPNIAWEVVRGVPSKAVVACSNYRYLGRLQELFSTPSFKVYENPDLVGTELGGALKNVIAIMAGIGDGLGYGANTKAAIITRGLSELVRVGVRLGGHRETFFGLSGLGDLMATSLSEHSRNRSLGEHLGRGLSLSEAEARLNGRVAEGIKTTAALFDLKGALALDTPIIDTLHRVLCGELDARGGYLATWNQADRFEGG